MTMQMATAPPTQPARLDAIAAAAATIVAVLLLNVAGLERATALMRRLHARPRGRLATISEASDACAAIDTGARWLPFRVACLERSVAAYLLLATRRRRVRWQLGVTAVPPLVVHAWIAAEGKPIGEIDNVASNYRPLLTV
jgi:hypothetical protein